MCKYIYLFKSSCNFVQLCTECVHYFCFFNIYKMLAIQLSFLSINVISPLNANKK